MDSRTPVKALYDGFARGDVAAVLGVLADDIVWTEAEGFPYAGTYEGQQAVVNGVFARLATEWDGYQAVPDSYVSEGATIVALGHYAGTYKATGRVFRAPFAHVWTVADGKIVRFVQYTDTAVVQRALAPA